MALSVPLSRSTLRVGGGSAFFVRHRGHAVWNVDDAACVAARLARSEVSAEAVGAVYFLA